MKIVVAPDSFKGSLTSAEICEIVRDAAHEVMSTCNVVTVPIADGGEGTVNSIICSCGGKKEAARVHDPLGRLIEAEYGIIELQSFQEGNNISARAAVIESAAASGLMLVSEDERDILRMNTYGTGEQVLCAIEGGCTEIYIGLGGTATNDGGMGFAAALGAIFFDGEGKEIEPLPENLGKVARADLSRPMDLLEGMKVIVMCDVVNPLLGQEGATAVYGPQKGVEPEMIYSLDEAMKIYADSLERAAGKSVRDISGAGAAGGLGACIMALADAEVRSGAQTVLELADFDGKLDGALLAITGEGRMDGQSAYGKAACRVGESCRSAGIPCVAIVGIKGDSAEVMYDHGISRIVETGRGMTIEESIERAEELCRRAAKDIISEFCLYYARFRENVSGNTSLFRDIDAERKNICVAAAVIRDGNRIFATRRGYGDYKGWWEFPGGKLKPGETFEQALSREIREELNIEIDIGGKLASIEYDYPRFHLNMNCYWCSIAEGKPELKEADASAWLRADELSAVRWLPSDIEIIEKIKTVLEKDETVG